MCTAFSNSRFLLTVISRLAAFSTDMRLARGAAPGALHARVDEALPRRFPTLCALACVLAVLFVREHVFSPCPLWWLCASARSSALISRAVGPSTSSVVYDVYALFMVRDDVSACRMWGTATGQEAARMQCFR